MNRNYYKLPKTIHDWLWLNKAWIVGSGVDWYINESDIFPKDLDILIPTNQWASACKLLDKSWVLNVNSFGGLAVKLDGIKVDFWTDNLEDFLEKSISTTNKKEIKALRLKPYTLIIAQR